MAFTPDFQDDSGNTIVPGNTNVQSITANGRVDLGNISNVHIYEGSNNQVMVTDGTGNLRWDFILSDQIYNGTSNVYVENSGAVTVGIAGVANKAQINPTGLLVAGNVDAANLAISGAGSFGGRISAASANITGVANIGTVTSDYLIASTGAVNIQAAVGDNDINLAATGNGNVNVTNARVVNMGNPVNPNDAATKQYVDGVSQGLVIKSPVIYATTVPLNLGYTYNNGTAGVGATMTGTDFSQLIIDGFIVEVGQRVLIKNEDGANSAYNGVYLVTRQGDGVVSWILTRAADFDVANDMYSGYMYVSAGADNSYTSWVCTNNATATPIVVGTSAITFVQFSDAAQYSAGPGISQNGTAFGANTDNITTTIIGGNIAVKPSAQLVTPNIGSATGTSLVTTADVVIGGNANVTGNINGSDVRVSNVYAGNVQATGSVVTTFLSASFGIDTNGNIAAVGNIRANNITANNALTGNTLAVSSNATVGGSITAGTATVTGTATVGNVSTTGFVTATGNVNAGNVITVGGQFSGNITAGNINVSGRVAATLLTGNITTASQPNITTLGTLTGLTVAGNSQLGLVSNVQIAGGSNGQVLTTDGASSLRWSSAVTNAAGTTGQLQYNSNGAFAASTGLSWNPNTNTLNTNSLSVTSTANLGAVGNVRITGGTNGFVLRTDGAGQLSWVDPATIPASTANNANFAGNVTGAAQPNITSVGTLSSLTVSGTTNLGTTTAGNIDANGVTVSGNVSANLITGTLTTNAQPNITSVGTLANLEVSGNVTAGAVTANTLISTVGNGTAPLSVTSVTRVANLNVDRAGNSDQVAVTAITSGVLYPLMATGNTSGNYAAQSVAGLSYNATTGALTAASFVGNISGNAALAGSVTNAAQPNITSLGTLANLTVNGPADLGTVSNVRISGGTSGQLLTTDGTGNVSWTDVVESAVGPNTSIQFNDDGLLTGVAALTFDKTNNTLSTNTLVATTSANLGAVGNITITGGNANQVLKTNGTGVLAWANVTDVLVAPGSNTQFQYNDGNALAGASGLTYNKLTNTTTVGNLQIGTIANLGSPANITISGGSFGYVLTTDGAGNLSWNAGGGSGNGNGVPGGVNTSVQFNDGGNFGGNANFTFNSVSGVFTAPTITAINGANLGANSNVVITGGTSGQYLQTDGAGALTWATVTGTAANPAGANTQLQFNNGTGFGASTLLRFISSNGALLIGNSTSNALTTIGTGFITTSNTITARAITLETTQGNSPLRVFSNTQVPNLNVTFLQGYQPSIASTANTIVVRDANSSVQANVVVATTLTVSNSGIVNNLNAARVANYAPNLTAQNSTIPVRDAAGNMYVSQTVGNLYGTVVGVAQSDTVFGTKLDIANVRMATNDAARVMVGGNTSNGFFEIATGYASGAGTDASPIHVRQYSGQDSSPFLGIIRQVTLLDTTGKTSFPVSVTAPSFIGNLTGNFTGNANINNFSVSGTFSAAALNIANSITVSNGNTVINANGLVTTKGAIESTGAYGSFGNVYANSGTIQGRTLTGNITTASQPNITQLGNLINLNVTGDIVGNTVTSNGVITGLRFVSTVATGTPPLTVNSNTLVANLNAEMLNGGKASSSNIANAIVQRDVGGNFAAGNITIQGATFQATGNTAPFAVSSTTRVANLNASFLAGYSAEALNVANTIVLRDSNSYINATRVVASQLQSTAANGSQPLLINSQTQVANLNASLLTGLAPSPSNVANTIVVRDATGSMAATDITYSGQLISQTTTASPFNVRSTILNANLNSELLGGYLPSVQNTPSTVVVRDAVGQIAANSLMLTGQITATTGNFTDINVSNVANIANDLVVGGNIVAANANLVIDRISANYVQVGVVDISGFGNGTSDVRIPVADGNIVMSVNGVSNVFTFASNVLMSNVAIESATQIVAPSARFTSNATGNNIFIGDDAIIGDVNKSNQLNIKGQTDANQGWISFGSNINHRIGKVNSLANTPISVQGRFEVSTELYPTSDVEAYKVLRIQGSKSTISSSDGGNVWLGAQRTGVFQSGTLTISNENGTYGAIAFGNLRDANNTLFRATSTQPGPLTWNADWSFFGINANVSSNTVTINKNLVLSGGTSNLTTSDLNVTGTFTANSIAKVKVAGTTSTVDIGYRYFPINIIPSGGSLTLGLTDASKILHQTGSAANVYVPTNSSTAFPLGTTVVILNTSAAEVGIRPINNGVTIVLGGTGNVLGATLKQWGQATLIKFDTDRWILTGTGLNTF
jgi:hypothetical protein